MVNADLGMIERVLTNLLDNAIKHNPSGTHIQIQLEKADQSVQVCVRDNGLGIPAELRQGLFTRASSLHQNRQGGGLGLVIVQRILQLHQSEIRLVDQQEPGSTFLFVLPAK